jgi:glycosyltransferase involved in cell wall biosynthesis
MIQGTSLKTSVVVITQNRASTIDLCLRSIENQTARPDELIVIDSSDDDETEKIIKNRNIVYFHAKRRLYQPEARNISLKTATGDIIAFVDDDVVCTSEWLENIVHGYYDDKIVGVGGPVVRCDQNLNALEEMKVSDENENFFNSCGDIHVERTWMPSKPLKTKLMMGGNMSFLTVKLKKIGGFDEFYGIGGAYREETDPQIALVKSGYDFAYMPRAIVYHLQHGSGGIRSNGKRDYYYWCGKYHKYLVDKYFPKWKSRLSWILWSFDPPCFWLCISLAIVQRNLDVIKWIKGLWSLN